MYGIEALILPLRLFLIKVFVSASVFVVFLSFRCAFVFFRVVFRHCFYFIFIPIESSYGSGTYLIPCPRTPFCVYVFRKNVFAVCR